MKVDGKKTLRLFRNHPVDERFIEGILSTGAILLMTGDRTKKYGKIYRHIQIIFTISKVMQTGKEG